MIRSVLNSLNSGFAAAAEHQPVGRAAGRRRAEEAADETRSVKSNDSESALKAGHNSSSLGRARGAAGKTMSSVKRGRKKLSSMMSKFRGASTKGDDGQSASDSENDSDQDRDDDEDDDEAAYKSAEEACRKMSLAEQAPAPGSRRGSILKGLKGRKSSSARRPSVSGGGADSDAYEQLKGDKKYILPEEQCDIPTFLQTKNCDPYLIEETRKLLKERYAKNPDNFYDADYRRMLTDDWTVSRFLLRRRLDPKRTAKLMEECGRFRKQYKMSEVQLWEFPMEFHKAGGLFKYAPDRVGNVTMYMRVKMYRRVPEISDVFKAFILCVLEQCDVANNGRGTAVVFDLTGCGLQNVDLGFLSWLLSSFRNYCPKGVSYILVYNLPWILNATCKLAMTWMSASNKRALRFVYGDEIENFIARENLPDYLGGECAINYRAIPEGSRPAIEVCDRLDMTREQAIKIRELFKEYLNDDDGDGDDQNNNQPTKGAGGHEAPSAPHDQTKPAVGLETLDSADGSRPVDLVSQASKFIAN